MEILTLAVNSNEHNLQLRALGQARELLRKPCLESFCDATIDKFFSFSQVSFCDKGWMHVPANQRTHHPLPAPWMLVPSCKHSQALCPFQRIPLGALNRGPGLRQKGAQAVIRPLFSFPDGRPGPKCCGQSIQDLGMANVSEVGFHCELDMLDFLDSAFLLSESH
jgi:hypothetical protein